MLLNPFADRGDGQVNYFGIGKAALDVSIHPFAIDEGKIFRVLFKQVPRNQGVEAVNEGKIDHGSAAVFGGQSVVFTVQPMPRGEIRVAHHLGPEYFTILQGWKMRDVEVSKTQPVG